MLQQATETQDFDFAYKLYGFVVLNNKCNTKGHSEISNHLSKREKY